ncbi:hypothetical protein [Bradyrhizobium lablabi]|uniref:hypothetical protein n=1 Tax=Bradyrhizobium lablabi TaxID=722472 RepID=UPI00090C384F|nr:hypothetical protein [Bradyrhizobium lablabi]SHL14836.1 hypothetical protein SAMN05444321_1910 [Bradyrhizobium lablabi]
MRKQKGTGKPPWMSHQLWTRIKHNPGTGERHDFIDWAFWLDLPPRDWPWVEALEQLDRLKDKKPLRRLLESDCELSSKVRQYLADLIERRCVPLPKGRPKTPAYIVSKDDALLMIAGESIRAYIQRGDSEEVALDKVEYETHLAKTALRNSYEGRRTSLRKSKKRL